MSTPDRHARVSALFLAALDVPPSERTAWLNAETSDPDLLELVSSMLAEHEDDTPAFFEEPLVSRPPDDRLIGQTIRGWTLTDRLGQGGMGSVYRAERADETFDQTAALKLVRPGFEHDFGVRFVRERALLASLDHPGIARLLDGGMTEDGAPYLAMELADGQPITTYAEDRQLDVPARLRLFLQACDAVAYAHRSLVVHRDLKPAHMLVTDGSGEEATDKRQGGMPSSSRIKLLDFGIAKLLADAEQQSMLTATGAVLGSPAWMAPEQAGTMTITSAADVYGLGCVMFFALTGRRPFQGSLMKVLLDHQQSPPPALPATVPRPLAAVVTRAMAKHPADRFDDAGQMRAALLAATAIADPGPSAPPTAHPAEGGTPIAVPAAAIRNRGAPWSRGIGLLALCLTLAGITAGALVAWHRLDADPPPTVRAAVDEASDAAPTDRVADAEAIMAAWTPLPDAAPVRAIPADAAAPDASPSPAAPATARRAPAADDALPEKRRPPAARGGRTPAARPEAPPEEPEPAVDSALRADLRACRCAAAKARMQAGVDDDDAQRLWQTHCGRAVGDAIGRCARSLERALERRMKACPCHDEGVRRLVDRLFDEFGVDRRTAWAHRCTTPGMPGSCLGY